MGLGIEKGLTAATAKVLDNVTVYATKAVAKIAVNGLGFSGRLALIAARGISDALYNANTVGLYDAFGGNHLEEYEDPYEQQAYLNGRIGGDALAAAQSVDQISVGGGVALSTGGATLGAGAVAGGVVALHGAGVGVTAAIDMGRSIAKLYKLNISTTAAGSAASSSPPAQSGGPSGNKGSAKKHGGTNHNDAIDKRVKELMADPNVLNIRKNQQQVDLNGKKVGTNRPDIQFNKYNLKTGKWEHHNIEYDTKPAASNAHGKQLKANDPNSFVELNNL